jgi:hypothetical protein
VVEVVGALVVVRPWPAGWFAFLVVAVVVWRTLEVVTSTAVGDGPVLTAPVFADPPPAPGAIALSVVEPAVFAVVVGAAAVPAFEPSE